MACTSTGLLLRPATCGLGFDRFGLELPLDQPGGKPHDVAPLLAEVDQPGRIARPGVRAPSGWVRSRWYAFRRHEPRRHQPRSS